MKILVSHPTSNQNNRAVLRGLKDQKLLYKFYTCIAVFSGGFLDKLKTIGPLKELSRRTFDEDLKKVTKMLPFKETMRLLSTKFRLKSLVKHETGLFSIDAVYHDIDKKVADSLKKHAKNHLDAVYAYEDGAYYSFQEAKKHHITCLYDLPIGYWRYARQLLAKEREAWPDWAATLTGFKDSEQKLQRKDEELALADKILVASTFTAKSLRVYPGKLAPVQVIPYGFPTPVSNRVYDISNRPLKLLFVGGLSQRKGIANMLAAVDYFVPKVQLTIIGNKSTNDCEALDKALSKHTWIPSLPHSEILTQMLAHDVLLFPSLFEGFGLVITEAMSQGTPVITTDRTAGPDLIEHGVNGWLVEAGSTMALQSCIESLVANPEKIIAAGKAALETAKKRPWSVYGKELAEALLKT
ncbi:glycosyltransferase family 4 protein [Litoribaculum gwangyangense]|uniref:Glycosyl transferase family 1 domain-containing protein n=1 Tax=Litoribaculum gwangyangense TaxID=1130722 RepID=A0ABP9CS08_9FLAO